MSLRVWLPLNGDLRNQGLSDFIVEPLKAPTYVDGKIGKCYQRANSSSQLTDGLRINDNLVDLFGNQASIAIWVKPLGTHTHYNGTFISSGNWNASRWAFGVSQDNTKVDVLCGGYNNYIDCAVPVNEWTHLVSVFDNGTCKLYKNGVYIGEKTGQAAFNSDATWTGIGRETYAGGYFGFNGCLNDLRIYDHCLSEKEVKEIAKGLILHYKLEDQKCGVCSNLIQSSKITFHSTQEWTGTGWASSFMIHDNLMDFLKPSTTYTFSWDGEIIERTSVPTKYSLQMGFLFYSASNSSANRASQKNNQTEAGIKHHISTTFTTPATIPDDYRIIYYTNRYTTNGGSPVGFDTVKFSNIKLEENDTETQYILSDSELNINSNIVEDCSGYFNNATVINNVSYSNDAPRYKTNVFLDSSSTIKVLTNNWVSQGMEAMTVNFWAKNTSWAGKHIFSCTESGGFNTEGGTSGYLRFPINVYTNAEKTSHAYKYDSKEIEISKLSTTDWNMLTFVYDNTGTRTYINGELHHTYNNTSYGIYFNMNARLFLGCEANGSSPSAPYFYGSLSDFRIYCTALSNDDIKELYQTSASIDNKQNFYGREFSDTLFDTTSITKAGTVLADDFIEDTLALIKDDRSIESNCFYEY